MYKCLPKEIYTFGEYDIVSIRKEDIFLIKQWRNEQMDILRQEKILTNEDQEAYYNNVIFPSFSDEYPRQILFSFLKKGVLIGYGGIVHISWRDKRGELSFLLESERNRDIEIFREEFTIFFRLVAEVAFADLGFNKITTEAYDLRPYLIRKLEEIGFHFEGRLKNHNLINGEYVDSIQHAYYSTNFLNQGKECKVLISSVSRKVPLIDAVRKAVQKISPAGNVYGGDTNSSAIGRFFVDDFWEMPLLQNLDVSDLITYCRQKKINAIIPTRDGELLFYAENAEVLRNNNIAVLISPKESVILCLDKLFFFQNCQSCGINAIPSFLDIRDATANSYVVKERYGAGSRSIGIDMQQDMAEKHAKTLQQPIFQPFIKGDEFSIDIYVTKKKVIKGLIIRKRDYVVNGESQITSNIKNDAIKKLAEQFVNAFEFFGHIILQVIVDPKGIPYLVECNPRFGGASSFSVSCGLDSFYWFLLEAGGTEIDHMPFVYEEEKKYKQVRYSKDLILNC